MLPARPKIVLLAPKQILPGRAATLTVRLDSPRPTPIDFVDLFLDGASVLPHAYQKFVRLGARLREAGKLEAGTTELDCRIELPADAPPSYEGVHLRLRYEARVHVSVPYWPDARRSFLLNVRPPPRAADENVTLLFASVAGGAPVSGPYAEVSLESRSVAPGDTLRGAVALYNLASSRYDRVTIALRQKERASAVMEHVSAAWAIELPITRFTEGAAVEFALRVPEVTPTFAYGGTRVHHELLVTARAGWSDVITMPISIDVLPDPNVELGRTKRAPALGEDRVRAIWARVAERHGLRLEDERLVRTLGERQLSVRRDLSSGTPRMLATLSYRSLGLGLRSTPRPFFQWLPSQTPDTGVSTIDGPLVFEGRNFAQCADVLARLGRALAPLVDGQVSVHAIDDERIVIAAADSGTTEAAVQRMVELSGRLAALAPLLDAIPLPPPLAGLEAEWRAFASRIGASLEPGSGTLERDDGDARVAVRPLFDAEGRVRALRCSRSEPVPFELAQPLHATGVEALASLRDEAQRAARPLLDRGLELALSSAEVSATDPQFGRDGLIPRVEDTLRDLARLADTLTPTRGPFR